MRLGIRGGGLGVRVSSFLLPPSSFFLPFLFFSPGHKQPEQVAAAFVPGIAGMDYTAQAVKAAIELLHTTGHADSEGPWIPVGVGVHRGTAYIGTVGSPEGMTDITILGDAANTASRLASEAGVGEIIVSEKAAELANLEITSLEGRDLDLKGKSEAIPVRVIRVEAEKNDLE